MLVLFKRRDRHRAGSPHAGEVVLPDDLPGHASVHQDPPAGGADAALLLPRGVHRRSQWQVRNLHCDIEPGYTALNTCG